MQMHISKLLYIIYIHIYIYIYPFSRKKSPNKPLDNYKAYTNVIKDSNIHFWRVNSFSITITHLSANSKTSVDWLHHRIMNDNIDGSCHKYHFCCNKRFVATNVFATTNVVFFCDKHMFVMTKYVFCCKKYMLVATKYCLYDCHNKTFAATNTCCNKHNFVMTKVLSWQKMFCHNKHLFVTTKHIVMTKDVFCCDKRVCCNKHVWHNKTFVATKMIFVAAVANDRMNGCYGGKSETCRPFSTPDVKAYFHV